MTKTESAKRDVIPEKTSKEFIDEIVCQIKSGYGITPYTGAGVSARSGIMLGGDFTNYLTWVIYLCIGKLGHANNTPKQPHDIRTDGWPNRPTLGEVREVSDWVQNEFVKIAERNGITIDVSSKKGAIKLTEKVSDNSKVGRGPGHPLWARPLVPRILGWQEDLSTHDEVIKHQFRDRGISSYLETLSAPTIRPDSLTGVSESAIRSLFEWRAMLDFLTRINVLDGRLVLSDRDESVIDSFNQHFTRGRKPNLTHSMLAHLAGPMRTRLLITTNFDSLHEEAFRASGAPFEVRDVTKAQGLPAVETVRAATCIIKLHGSHTGTRADFSLDRPPELGENEKFFKWITGRYCSGSIKDRWLPSHLMVIGASGDDTRCLHFIKYLLDASDDTKIFWVCFDAKELQKVQRLFFENEYRERLIVTVTDRSDLLLLELYQAITLTLPKGGFSYHYSHDVPPKIWENTRQDAPPYYTPGGERLDPRFSLAVNESIREVVDAIKKKSDEHPTDGLFAIIQSFPTFDVIGGNGKEVDFPPDVDVPGLGEVELGKYLFEKLWPTPLHYTRNRT